MARLKGIAPFSGNFEPQIAAPLDARLTVATHADLTNASAWLANDGGTYVYKGLLVAVTDDPNPSNNGIYYLTDLDVTQATNWKKLDTAGAYDLHPRTRLDNLIANGGFYTNATGWTYSGTEQVKEVVSSTGALSGYAFHLASSSNSNLLLSQQLLTAQNREYSAIAISLKVKKEVNDAGVFNINLLEGSNTTVTKQYNFADTDWHDILFIAPISSATATLTVNFSYSALSAYHGYYISDVYIVPTIDISAQVTYTNASPTPISLGGVSQGTTFNAKTMKDMWDMLLYPELFPTLTAPSASISVDASEGLHEIGEQIESIDFTTTFNRGAITPAYGTSGYRSGLPSSYTAHGPGFGSGFNTTSTALSHTDTINDYTIASGDNTWYYEVFYSAGEQPLSSKGNNYSTPLPAGSVVTNNFVITGVYPYFGTSVDIATLTKQALALHNAPYFQVNMVAESGGNKQKAAFSSSHSAITGVQFFNTVSNQWEWINGSKANSLSAFTTSATQITINGASVNYTVYTWNGATVGARQLRFYTT
jgi:hypothetical protein